MKLSILIDDTWVELIHDNRFDIHEYPNGTRSLQITAAQDQTALIRLLARLLPGPWYVLYLLTTSRRDHRLGRYQSPPLEDLADIAIFLTKYAAFLEHDGRHSLWICSCAAFDKIVWDSHNLIHFYGDIDAAIPLLQGFRREEAPTIGPHAHHYWKEYDDQEDTIVDEFPWIISDLRPGDDPGRV